jgi:hypothetical protein
MIFFVNESWPRIREKVKVSLHVDSLNAKVGVGVGMGAKLIDLDSEADDSEEPHQPQHQSAESKKQVTLDQKGDTKTKIDNKSNEERRRLLERQEANDNMQTKLDWMNREKPDQEHPLLLDFVR